MLTNYIGRIITRGRRFIPEVDGLRFVAITAVVLYHLSGYTRTKHMTGGAIGPGEAWFPQVLGLGRYGVQLFFVLSGFLLAMPFAKWRLHLGDKPSLRKYYLRRLTRLEPPYIVSMLLLFLGGVAALGRTVGLSHSWNLVASLFYQHNLIYGDGSVINYVAWSLEVEVQFYLLAPFLASVFSISGTAVRRSLLAVAIVAIPMARELVPAVIAQRVGLSLPWFLEFFVAGFLLAEFFLIDWKEQPTLLFRYDLASFTGWSAILILLLSRRFAALMAPAVLLAYVGAFRGRASSWLLSLPAITAVGGMCYSMYLLHYAIISITGRFANRLLWGNSFSARLALEAIFAIPAILVATLAFYLVLERPCMDPTWPLKLRLLLRRHHRTFL